MEGAKPCIGYAADTISYCKKLAIVEQYTPNCFVAAGGFDTQLVAMQEPLYNEYLPMETKA